MHDAPQIQLYMGDAGLRWRDVASGRTFPWIGGGDGDTPAPDVEIPADVATLSDDELTVAQAAVQAAVDDLAARAASDPDSITADDATRAVELATALKAINEQAATRAAARQETVDSVAAALADVATPVAGADGAPVEDPAEEAPAEGNPPATDVPAADPPAEGELVPEDEVEVLAASTRQPIRVPAAPARGTMNPVLTPAQIAAGAPGAPVLNRRPVQELVLTAAANIPGVTEGGRLPDLDSFADAMIARANSMGISHGGGSPMPVASIRRHFAHVIGENASLADVDRIFEEIVGQVALDRTAMTALVAAGGWCAPSEIDYSFFSVHGAPSGMWDVPTVGINRGGLRWPISLNLADFFALSGAPASGIPSNATMPWEWTETDDILAVTGSPTKSCLRPPCPSFDEERLRVFGICVLSGNLTDDAYPELVRHFLGLTTVAHARVMNRRHILMGVADPTVTATTPVKGAATSAITHFLGAAELLSTHLRYKYGAPLTAVLELVLPAWVRGVLRNDIARRNAWDDLSVADAWLSAQLDERNVRVQWVEDWQALPGSAGPAGTIGAATAPTSWPTSFQGLMYFPGHFFRGNGLNLNVGALRDSLLNEANDHTAAWSEEATMIGARGPQALLINFTDMWPNGVSGAQTAQTAASA